MNISEAGKVDNTNKDLQGATLYLAAIYQAFKQMKDLKSDAELRELLGVLVED